MPPGPMGPGAASRGRGVSLLPFPHDSSLHAEGSLCGPLNLSFTWSFLIGGHLGSSSWELGKLGQIA